MKSLLSLIVGATLAFASTGMSPNAHAASYDYVVNCDYCSPRDRERAAKRAVPDFPYEEVDGEEDNDENFEYLVLVVDAPRGTAHEYHVDVSQNHIIVEEL